MIGMGGFFFFLSLVLLVKLSNKHYGSVLLAFSLYAVYILASGMAKKDGPRQ